MPLEEIKKRWSDLYADNKLKCLFKEISGTVNTQSEQHTSALILASRYNSVMDDKMIGVLSYSEATEELNKIGFSLVTFIKELQEEDIVERMVVEGIEKSVVTEDNLIDNPILVITTCSKKLSYLNDFFKITGFSNVSLRLIDQLPTLIGYDLIILDNQDLKECPKRFLLDQMESIEDKNLILDRVALMDELLKNTTSYFIHFGDFLYWVSDNRNRVHAANSTFSLFARTKEMIDFINTYRVKVNGLI